MAGYQNLNAEKGFIWRIVHRLNMPWLMANGLSCATSHRHSPNWVAIGNRDLIDRRATRVVPIAPGGVLNDYVPFYFTPFSPMMYNIYTGRGGIPCVANSDILILVSSIPRLEEQGIQYIFTDRHAYTVTANFYNSRQFLTEVDWEILQRRNFSRDPNDPEKVERYQAEALVPQFLPISALLGVVCYNDVVKEEVLEQARLANVQLDIRTIPQWYF